MMPYKTPAEYLSEDERNEQSMPYRESSRIIAFKTGRSKSTGASCNTFSAADNISDTEDSISDAHRLAYIQLAYQGAPSIDFSRLRPKGSKLGSGGTSSGAISFMRPFDSIVSTMRREEKKNGAGIAYLDYKHQDLDEFLEADFSGAYKGVYVPMHDTPEAQEFLSDSQMVTKLTLAYNNNRCFLVKRPLPVNGEPLFVNLCTEVEIPHRGYCVLGAINLSYFNLDNMHHLPMFFNLGVQKLTVQMRDSMTFTNNSKMYCKSALNKQFGLGVYGLASCLGNLGITYESFNEALWSVLAFTEDIDEVAENTIPDAEKGSDDWLVHHLVSAYAKATQFVMSLDDDIRAAFCIQPTPSTAQRSLDYLGYRVSPEIQPAIGLKHVDAVSTLVKSELKGDKVIDYSPNTWTTDDVPYETYALTSSLWQRLMNNTGLAHRHSHCFYGKTFTEKDLTNFYLGNLRHRKSLYYRLPFNQNSDSLKKDQLWQTVEDNELFDGDLNCFGSVQMPGKIQCECEM